MLSLTTAEEYWREFPSTVGKSHSLQNKEYYSIFKTRVLSTHMSIYRANYIYYTEFMN